jgi:acyl-CoA thioesterase I
VLELNPDLTYFGIGYGTNDSRGNVHASGSSFEANMVQILDRIIAAGHVPIIERIPYSSVERTTLSEFNAVVDRLTRDYGLPCGPDLFTYFKKNPDELSADGVHPTDLGYQAMNGQWAKAVLPLYPEP